MFLVDLDFHSALIDQLFATVMMDFKRWKCSHRTLGPSKLLSLLHNMYALQRALDCCFSPACKSLQRQITWMHVLGFPPYDRNELPPSGHVQLYRQLLASALSATGHQGSCYAKSAMCRITATVSCQIYVYSSTFYSCVLSRGKSNSRFLLLRQCLFPAKSIQVT